MNTNELTRIENNKLIAIFMGFVLSGFQRSMLFNSETREEFSPAELKYHKSWDSLMPVIEKIEILGYTFEKNYQRIDKDWQILIVKGNDILFQEFNADSLKATYVILINFIEWHNSQNS